MTWGTSPWWCRPWRSCGRRPTACVRTSTTYKSCRSLEPFWEWRLQICRPVCETWGRTSNALDLGSCCALDCFAPPIRSQHTHLDGPGSRLALDLGGAPPHSSRSTRSMASATAPLLLGGWTHFIGCCLSQVWPIRIGSQFERTPSPSISGCDHGLTMEHSMEGSSCPGQTE